MTHATHMAAMNAARKQFGKDWKEVAKLEKLDGQWYVQLIQKEEPTPVIPVTPIIPKVAELEAPALAPALPAFLQIAPQPEAEVAPALPGMITEALPQDDLDVAALQAEADAQANTDLINDRGVLTDAPVAKAARPRLSTTEKPTKKVWAIADSMPGAKRKDVIDECVRQGIAYGTARTQYQHWFKCIADQKAAPLAVIGADGKITITNGN